MYVDHGGGHIAMPKKLLDGEDVIIRLQQMCGECCDAAAGFRPIGGPEVWETAEKTLEPSSAKF
jgi:hypothetical protein